MADTRLGILLELLYRGEGGKQAARDLQQVAAAGNQTAPSLRNAGTTAGFLQSQLGKLVTGGTLVYLGKQMVDLGVASISAASDAEEAASKFKQTFGGASADVSAELTTFAENVGRSRLQLQGMAADIGAVITPMLGSKQAAGEMSAEIVKLTTDLSSFHNVSENDVLGALRSGLTGESEPLKRFGILLRQTDVDARVLASGIATTKDEITEAMRVAARWEIILESTRDAQGDAARTSDGLANSSRGLAAALHDLKVAMGEAYTDEAGGVTRFLTEVVSNSARSTHAVNLMNEALERGIITADEFDEMFDRFRQGNGASAAIIEDLTGRIEELDRQYAHWVHSAGLTAAQVEELSGGTAELAGKVTFTAGQISLMAAQTNILTRSLTGLSDAEARAVMDAQALAERNRFLTAVWTDEREVGLEVEAMIEDYRAATIAAAEASTLAAEADEERAAVMGGILLSALGQHIDLLDELAQANADYQAAVGDDGVVSAWGRDAQAAEDAQTRITAALEGMVSNYKNAALEMLVADAGGVFTQDAADFAVAAGLMTRETANQRIETERLYNEELPRLHEAYRTGQLTAEEFAGASNLLASGLASTASAAIIMSTEAGTLRTRLGEARSSASDLKDAMLELEGSYEVNVHTNYTQSGEPPMVPGSAAAGAGTVPMPTGSANAQAAEGMGNSGGPGGNSNGFAAGGGSGFSLVINVDARGAADPAAVEESARRGAGAAAVEIARQARLYQQAGAGYQGR